MGVYLNAFRWKKKNLYILLSYPVSSRCLWMQHNYSCSRKLGMLIDREAFCESLINHGMGEQLLEVIKVFCKEVSACVRGKGELRENFVIRMRVRQAYRNSWKTKENIDYWFGFKQYKRDKKASLKLYHHVCLIILWMIVWGKCKQK